MDDMFTHLRDAHGNLTGLTRAVTPAEISAAHPKCGSCDWCGESPPDVPDFVKECDNDKSQHLFVDPNADYCRWHSELMKGKQDDKG